MMMLVVRMMGLWSSLFLRLLLVRHQGTAGIHTRTAAGAVWVVATRAPLLRVAAMATPSRTDGNARLDRARMVRVGFYRGVLLLGIAGQVGAVGGFRNDRARVFAVEKWGLGAQSLTAIMASALFAAFPAAARPFLGLVARHSGRTGAGTVATAVCGLKSHWRLLGEYRRRCWWVEDISFLGHRRHNSLTVITITTVCCAACFSRRRTAVLILLLQVPQVRRCR